MTTTFGHVWGHDDVSSFCTRCRVRSTDERAFALECGWISEQRDRVIDASSTSRLVDHDDELELADGYFADS